MTLSVTETLLLAAALATFVDQATKALAGRLLAEGRFRVVVWRSGFRWVLNRRGGLVATPLRWAIVLWVFALACAALLWVLGSPGTAESVGLGLALGGATSNLGDRVVRGGVADFIALRAWPAFNVADAAMVSGTVLLAGSLA